MWSAEKDVLRKRMADGEAENIVSILTWTHFFAQYRPSNIPRSLFFLLLLQRLLAKLTNKEKELSKLAEHLDFEKVWTSRLVLPKWKDNTAGIFVPSLSHSNMHLFKVRLFQIKKNSSSLSTALNRKRQRRRRSSQESCSRLVTIWNQSWTEWRMKRPIWLLRFRSVDVKYNKTHS